LRRDGKVYIMMALLILSPGCTAPRQSSAVSKGVSWRTKRFEALGIEMLLPQNPSHGVPFCDVRSGVYSRTEFASGPIPYVIVHLFPRWSGTLANGWEYEGFVEICREPLQAGTQMAGASHQNGRRIRKPSVSEAVNRLGSGERFLDLDYGTRGPDCTYLLSAHVPVFICPDGTFGRCNLSTVMRLVQSIRELGSSTQLFPIRTPKEERNRAFYWEAAGRKNEED